MIHRLQLGRIGYMIQRVQRFQIQATEAMGALKAGLGEWEKAKQHYLNALQIATEANEDFAQSKIMVDLLTLDRKSVV